jgi:predicted HAD superfamily Cof-like phosphohydrolase
VKAEIARVREFHKIFHCYSCSEPEASIPEKEIAVRLALMQEELDEYRQAANEGDLIAVADALTDLLYVVFGTLVAHGLEDAAEDLFAEVHRSNMSKLDENGKPIHRADGKVLKSARFTQPDLKMILEKYSKNGMQPADGYSESSG